MIRKDSEIKIIAYSDKLKLHFKRLNTEWLEVYFEVEEKDTLIFSDPRKYIIDKGGYIFFARLEDEIVGTAALMKRTNGDYELSKMGVTPSAQGRGVAKRLIAYCLEFAKGKGIQALVLYSNTSLKPAMHLYRKYGFVEEKFENGGYNRCDVKMIKKL